MTAPPRRVLVACQRYCPTCRRLVLVRAVITPTGTNPDGHMVGEYDSDELVYGIVMHLRSHEL